MKYDDLKKMQDELGKKLNEQSEDGTGQKKEFDGPKCIAPADFMGCHKYRLCSDGCPHFYIPKNEGDSQLEADIKKALTLGEIEKTLRELFPHGHEDFIGMTIEEMDLHSRKNFDYAGGGKPTGNFDRVGAIVSMYPNVKWGKPQNVAMFYSLKQIDAYLWLENTDRDGAVEGKDARMGDVSIYSKIMRLIMRDKKKRVV